MNRQKKELLKQIRELETWIEVDQELGHGVAPPGAYDRIYREIYGLQEQLAHLMHYGSAEEMFCDERGQRASPETVPPYTTPKSRQSHRKSKEMTR